MPVPLQFGVVEMLLLWVQCTFLCVVHSVTGLASRILQANLHSCIDYLYICACAKDFVLFLDRLMSAFLLDMYIFLFTRLSVLSPFLAYHTLALCLLDGTDLIRGLMGTLC